MRTGSRLGYGSAARSSGVDRRNWLRLAAGSVAAAIAARLTWPSAVLAESGAWLRDILDSDTGTLCSLRNGADVRRFYDGRDYSPAWNASSDADLAIAILRDAKADGFAPGAFRLDDIQAGGSSSSFKAVSNFELLLTDAMLTYLNDMRGVRSQTLRKHLPYGLPQVAHDSVDTLSRALDGRALDDLPLTAAPSHVEYAWLRRAGQGLQKKRGSSGSDQIIANMERWRWLPKPFEDTYVVVNSADATLKYVHEGDVALESRIVAGKATTPTPLFKTEITAVIVNPFWDIPGDIAANEIWPKEQRRPGFFSTRQIVADRPGGALRQLPGPDNVLGHFLFEMPNDFDSYLHDTPNKELFAKQDRHFSHGCMRVEQMPALASCVLNGDPDSAMDQIGDAIAAGETQRLPLSDPVPVYVLYWTAVPGENDALSRHHDVYGWDKKVLDALRSNHGSEDDMDPDCTRNHEAANLSPPDVN